MNKLSKLQLAEDRKIKKSVKHLFETLEFNMVNKEVGEGVATKEELDLKTRVSKIIQKEQKRYNPTHTNPKITFQHQREKMERMMD